jgi:hypothetical protein
VLLARYWAKHQKRFINKVCTSAIKQRRRIFEIVVVVGETKYMSRSRHQNAGQKKRERLSSDIRKQQ